MTDDLLTTEEELTAIWQDVFKVPADEIDPEDGFFEVGGTSLQAVQLMNRIQQAFDIKVPLPVIYTEGSIAGLTAIVEEALEEELRLLQEAEEREAAEEPERIQEQERD